MQDPQALRDLAKRCRKRAKISAEREVIEQLCLWATELADAADENSERLSGSGSGSVSMWGAQSRAVATEKKRASGPLH
jgi:hypothetical protein